MKFMLNDKEWQTVDELKRKLTALTILALPRTGGEFTIETDACDKKVGCGLQREQEPGVLR